MMYIMMYNIMYIIKHNIDPGSCPHRQQHPPTANEETSKNNRETLRIVNVDASLRLLAQLALPLVPYSGVEPFRVVVPEPGNVIIVPASS